MLNENLRVAIVRLEPSVHISDESLVEVLRPHLEWSELSREDYDYMRRGLENGMTLLVDHRQDNQVMTVQDAVAHEVDRYQKAEAASQARAAARSVSTEQTVVGAKRKPKKGLTARQQAELEALRKELGDNNG